MSGKSEFPDNIPEGSPIDLYVDRFDSKPDEMVILSGEEGNAASAEYEEWQVEKAKETARIDVRPSSDDAPPD